MYEPTQLTGATKGHDASGPPEALRLLYLKFVHTPTGGGI